MAKASKIEKEKRVFTIQGWIIDGVPDYLIKKQALTQWGVSSRMVRNYIKEAYENWRQDEEIDIEMRRSSKIAELKQLKRTLKEEYKGTPSGIRAIMMVEKEIIKVDGLVVNKHKIEATVTHTEMSREEREAFIKKMQEKVIKDVDL